jgi:hypothetical protein
MASNVLLVPGRPEALPSPILRRLSSTRLFDGLTDFDQISIVCTTHQSMA